MLNLHNGERIVEGLQSERYLIRKCQEIIIVIEDLRGHRIVLREGVAGKIFDSGRNPHTLIAILRKDTTKLRFRKSKRNIHVVSDRDIRLGGNGGHSRGVATARTSSRCIPL